jgi:hypothetical protein
MGFITGYDSPYPKVWYPPLIPDLHTWVKVSIVGSWFLIWITDSIFGYSLHTTVLFGFCFP